MHKPRIGYIGVGLMGHGAAGGILRHGYPLMIAAHRNRAPVDDLVSKGAKEAATPAEVVRASDIVFLCLPSSVEVEATIYGENGVLAGAREGLVLVDSTTSDPLVTSASAQILPKKPFAWPTPRRPHAEGSRRRQAQHLHRRRPRHGQADSPDRRVLRRHDH
jgi:3-hydroxyisobutyrate dehydrogenase-like beta-hydroxyacid dehydrogenase